MSETRQEGAAADRLTRAADPGFVWPIVAAGPQTGPGALPVGSPGKVGVLDLDFCVDARGRTVLAERFQKSPLQVMRPLYIDPVLDRMPTVYVMSTGGGIVGGDRLDMDVRLGEGAHALITTQAANRVHRMDVGYATQNVELRLGAGAVCELLPDPIIPYGGSRFQQRLRAEVPADAVLIAAEILTAGRVAHGETWEVDAYVSTVEISRPDGTPLVVDTTLVTRDLAGHPLVAGAADAIGSLFVVAPGPANDLASVMRGAADLVAGQSHEVEGRPHAADVRCGVSTLPHGCGAWLRVLGSGQENVEAAVQAVWSAARQHVLGVAAPELRKN